MEGRSKFRCVLKDLQIADQNFEVNWVSLSEKKSEGGLWIRKRSFMTFLGTKKTEAAAGDLDFLINFLSSFSIIYFFEARGLDHNEVFHFVWV